MYFYQYGSFKEGFKIDIECICGEFKRAKADEFNATINSLTWTKIFYKKYLNALEAFILWQ